MNWNVTELLVRNSVGASRAGRRPDGSLKVTGPEAAETVRPCDAMARTGGVERYKKQRVPHAQDQSARRSRRKPGPTCGPRPCIEAIRGKEGEDHD